MFMTMPSDSRTLETVTLAGASAAALSKVLEKRQKKGGGRGDWAAAQAAAGGVLPAPRAGVAALDCGAPANTRATLEAEADGRLERCAGGLELNLDAATSLAHACPRATQRARRCCGGGRGAMGGRGRGASEGRGAGGGCGGCASDSSSGGRGGAAHPV